MVAVFLIIAFLCLGIPSFVAASDEAKLVILAILGIIAIPVGICMFVYYANSYSCERVAKKQGFEYDYSLFEGCMVKYDGKWRAYNKLRFVEDKDSNMYGKP